MTGSTITVSGMFIHQDVLDYLDSKLSMPSASSPAATTSPSAILSSSSSNPLSIEMEHECSDLRVKYDQMEKELLSQTKTLEEARKEEKVKALHQLCHNVINSLLNFCVKSEMQRVYADLWFVNCDTFCSHYC
jgi:hypothetical protein